MNKSRKRKILVVGGGISGLATAYYLQQKHRKFNAPVEIQLLEGSQRLGGLIETIQDNNSLMEIGPESFITEKPWALDLIREIGLEDELIETNLQNRKSFIVWKKKLYPMPEGFYLLAPTSLGVLAKTNLLSIPGKLRMAMDLIIPRRQSEADESVASFIRRRLGKEALERLGQPMMAGIYGADPETLSMKSAFPKFWNIESDCRSIIKGLHQGRHRNQLAAELASGPRYSLFLSFRNGMETLIKGLHNKLSDVSIELSTKVKRLERSENWKAYTTSGNIYEADAICLALPAYQSAEILKGCAPELSDVINQIRYEPAGTLNMLFNKKDIAHPLNAFGFVVPEVEKRSLIGCTFSSIKFMNRSLNPDKVLLRAFIGGALNAGIMNLPDHEIKERVFSDLKELLGVKEVPVLSMLKKYRRAMPQYDVGHEKRVESIQNKMKSVPGLFVAGNWLNGVGIPDSIHDAELKSERILQWLSLESETNYGTKKKEEAMA